MIARKNKAEADPTICPLNISTFFVVIPDEVKAAVPLLHELSSEQVNSIIEKSIFSVNNHQLQQDDEFIQYSRSSGISCDKLSMLITGTQLILRVAVRNKVLTEVIANDLRKMNIPDSTVYQLCQQIRSQRSFIENSAINSRIRFPRIARFKWRVDITISTGSVSRVMRPVILFQVY